MCYCVSLSVPVILSLPWQVWYSRLDSIARNGEGKQIGSVVKIKEVHVVCRLRKFCVFRICHFPVLRYFGLWLPTISANENSGVRGEATKSAFPSLKKTWFCRTCAIDFLYCEPLWFPFKSLTPCGHFGVSSALLLPSSGPGWIIFRGRQLGLWNLMPDSTILHDTSDLHVKRKRKVILMLLRAEYCHHFLI